MTAAASSDDQGDLAAALRGTAHSGTAGGAAGESPLVDPNTRSVEPGEEYVRLSDFEAVAKERDERLSDLQRMTADFDNFRKRARRDQELVAQAANDALLLQLLEVIDDLDRAVSVAAEFEEGDPAAPLADGVRMVHQRLSGVLSTNGLTQIDTSGEFDPQLHEAMLMQPAEGVADGSIINVIQTGWALNGRVLRHARVIVAGTP